MSFMSEIDEENAAREKKQRIRKALKDAGIDLDREEMLEEMTSGSMQGSRYMPGAF